LPSLEHESPVEMTKAQAATAEPVPTALSHTDRGTLWGRATLIAATVGLVVLYAPTVYWLWGRWTMSVWNNAHGALIPPIVAYLIYQELREQRARAVVSRPSAWGFVLLLPAMVLQALDAGMHTQLLSAISIVFALPGFFLLTLGVERTRTMAFPLVFLAFALPIPLGVTETIHLVLRHVAVAATASIVPLLGIPVFAEGTTLHMAQGALQVADACSGFSTLYASFAVAVLTAYTTPTTGRRLLVLLSAAPLAIASNVVRIVTLVALVVWVGPEILETFVHPLSGMLTFALALPAIFWLGGSSGSTGARA
jgi:exosortase